MKPHDYRRAALGVCLALAGPLVVGCSNEFEIPFVADGGTRGVVTDSAAPNGDGGTISDDDGATTNVDGATTNDGAISADSAPAPKIVHYVPGVDVGTFAGSDSAGSQDGNGATARFSNPVGVAFDAQGNLLVTEWDGNRVRRVTPSGDVTTVSAAPQLHGPFALTLTTGGMLIVQADYDLNGVKTDTSGTLWKIGSSGAATMLVASMGRPRGLASLSNGNVVVVDRLTHWVQILTPSTAQMTALAGSPGNPGFVDGVGSSARFNTPYGAAIFPDGSILVADWMNYRLRRIALDGTVTTFAGNGTQGMVDGPRLSAQLDAVRGVAIDAAGNVFFTDIGNHRIRRVSTAGDVETIAGDGTAGFQDGTGEAARFYGQEGLIVTPDGKTLYVADGSGGEPNLPYHRVRAIAVP